jgi:ammonia channel protein AmtB
MKTQSILNKNLRDNNARLLILFIFWPFLGFLLALKNFQNKFNQKIILIFFVLFGLLFYVNPLQDGQRRADGLKEAYNQPFEMAFNAFDNLFIFNTFIP